MHVAGARPRPAVQCTYTTWPSSMAVAAWCTAFGRVSRRLSGSKSTTCTHSIASCYTRGGTDGSVLHAQQEVSAFFVSWAHLCANEVDTALLDGIMNGCGVHSPVVGVFLLLQLHHIRLLQNLRERAGSNTPVSAIRLE